LFGFRRPDTLESAVMEAALTNLPRSLGRYEIVGRLAMGGMAEILLGRITGPSGFERPVVIKRILPHYAAVSAFVEMLLDEGRLAARIRHPNVVQVQELGREGDEVFLVMEYLEGESAAGLLRRARVRRLPIQAALAAHIASEACAGLHAAHELTDSDGAPIGVVHRDISPQNIFVTYDGTVKILDFGIAKAADRITRTEAGTLKGKFEYMSPEQARGEPLDRRSDVFALGIVLYELATQRRLFKRDTQLATLRAVTDDPITAPAAIDAGVPRGLEWVTMRALDRDPKTRYATAIDMRRDLSRVIRELDAPALPEEALGALMRELFADRIEQKQEMLRRMREGFTPSHVPVADVDEAVEIPSIAGASQVRTKPYTDPDIPAKHRGFPAKTAMAALAVLALAVGGVAAFVLISESAVPVAAAPSALAGAATLTIETEPPGARVRIDGDDRGSTPLSLDLARSDRPLSLELVLDGHAALRETVTPDESQRLRFSLTPLAEPISGNLERPRERESRPRTRVARMAEEPAMSAPEEDPTRMFRRFN
jgi:serine/threonine protein kinase